MLFLNSTINFIKYIFFLQILYCNILSATETDFRANPEVGINKKKETAATVFSKKFMIVCADKRASYAARKILEKGGNAIDAAIAAQNVLSVVEPQSSGLGGGGFLIFYNKEKNLLEAWDGREFSSRNASAKQYIGNDDKKMDFLNVRCLPART